MRISIAIMAVGWEPERAEHARQLSAELDAEIVWDRRRNEWDTGTRALAARDRDADFHLVLQDDAVVVPDFRRHAAAALAAVSPKALVSFYVGTGAPVRAQPAIAAAIPLADSHGLAWFGNAPTTGVALALPTSDIVPLRRWARDRTEPYDERIWTFYSRRRRPVLATWPSLADHRDSQTVANVGKPIFHPRRAWRVGIPERWDTQAVFLKRLDEAYGAATP